jgi:hypothetical protein
MEPGSSQELKERQRYWLEHLGAASGRGMSLAEYARAKQLDSDALYRWRALFKRKGISPVETSDTAAAAFSAVRIAAGADAHGAVTVRVGALLQVQCSSLPSPQWLAELSEVDGRSAEETYAPLGPINSRVLPFARREICAYIRAHKLRSVESSRTCFGASRQPGCQSGQASDGGVDSRGTQIRHEGSGQTAG